MLSQCVNGSTSLLLTPHITWSQSPPQRFGTSFTKFGTSFIKFSRSDLITSKFNLETSEHGWFMIGGRSPPRNTLWNPWYILPKIWYILNKIWYIWSYCLWDHIWTWMVHDFILEPIRNWLGVDPHLGTHFGTLGTSFTKFGTSFVKFGTSHSIAFETPILSPRFHNFI